MSASDRARLEAIASDRNRPQKHVERARVVLASLAGDPLQAAIKRYLAEHNAAPKPFVWKAIRRLGWYDAPLVSLAVAVVR